MAMAMVVGMAMAMVGMAVVVGMAMVMAMGLHDKEESIGPSLHGVAKSNSWNCKGHNTNETT